MFACMPFGYLDSHHSNMYHKLSGSCLKVVCARIYFDLPNGVVLASYCLSAKVVLPYLKPYPNPKHMY